MRSSSLTILVSLVTTALVCSNTMASSRHPTPTTRRLPAGVPAGYVFTHHGYFHPSCVYTVHQDESFTEDGRILGRDGVQRDLMPPCPYARYSRDGKVVGKSDAKLPSHSAADNGWLLFYEGGIGTSAKVPTGATLSTTWKVPAPPTSVPDGLDLAFFNGFELDSEKTDVLIFQPVLDYNYSIGNWIVESESCCANGNDVQTDALGVSPGDIIRGTITPLGCDSTTGACTTFVIESRDVTLGTAITLTGYSSGLVADTVVPGVFETEGVTDCSDLPASGEVVFDNTVTDTQGKKLSLPYAASNCVTASCPGDSGDLSLVPKTCGWNTAQADGDEFTLTFGSAPYVVDGGEPTGDGSIIDYSADGGLYVSPDLSATEPDMSVAAEDASMPTTTTKHGGGCSLQPNGARPMALLTPALLLLFYVRRRTTA